MKRETFSPKKQFIKKLLSRFSGKSVVGLVGKSGSGKSFRALLLVEKYGFDVVIDDGLIIQNQSIVTGRTAKSASNYLEAVRIALFEDPLHRKKAINALKTISWKRLLLLGTSKKLIYTIAETLNLPIPKKFIQITDIATKNEIDIARRLRDVKKLHSVPVPQIEIKKNVPSKLRDSIRSFIYRYLPGKQSSLQPQKKYEHSVIIPTYATMKGLSIHDSALSQILIHCVQEFDSTFVVNKILLHNTKNVGIDVNLEIKVSFRYDLNVSMHGLREYIIMQVQKFVSIYINKLSITIKSVEG